VERPVLLDWPEARREGGALFGECLAADPFGNVLTSIRASDVADLLAGGGSPSAEVQGRPARLVRTFGDGAPGELLALVGSSGRLEIAVREGSAAAFLGVVRGAPVVLRA